MAIVRAVKTGNWSDTTVWNTGALPTSSDDVYSNTFTVTIDTSPTVLSISNAAATGVTAGGSFVPTNGITLTCTAGGIVGGTAASAVVVESSLTTGQSCVINANVSAGSNGNCHGIRNNGAGTISITGNCTGGSNGSVGCVNNSTGTVNIAGNCTGNGNTSYGANNASTGTINVTGNCQGTLGSGNANTGYGVNNAAGGVVNVTGTCTGGVGTSGSAHGVANSSTGTVNITGICAGGQVSNSNGAINLSTGTLVHVGAAQSSTSAPAIGSGVIGQITTLTGPLNSTSTAEGSAAASGVNPCVALRWFPADTALSTFTYTMRGATVSGSPSSRPARVLSLPENSSTAYPAASNVRSGTVYGVGNAYTGTCAVPGAASVVVGVPVDNTTGTAAVTAATIRSAMGLASANLDTQLSGINNNVLALPSAATIASTIWQSLTSGLTSAGSIGKLIVDNINATISSRLAASSYTAPLDSSGTRSAIGLASANLDTQLAPLPNLDTTVSSRLAAAAYQAPLDASGTRAAIGLASANMDSQFDAIPTASENAVAVESQLAIPLGNLDVAVSTRSTFNPATDTVAQVTLVDTTTNLTNPPDVPTTAEIATAVANELEPTLTTIDDNVLSRLAAVDYTTPPTAEQNATAVRVELSPELERVQNCATVATTGQQIQDALTS